MEELGLPLRSHGALLCLCVETTKADTNTAVAVMKAVVAQLEWVDN